MEQWKDVMREGLILGSAASLLSTLALAAFGRLENRNPVAPINATSHWLWGDRALRAERPTLKHTGLGYLIHHASSVFWAVIYSGAYGRKRRAKQPVNALVGGAAAAALACTVDYKLTPKRLTPGFEHRLSTPAMVGVYAAFGLGIALAGIALGRKPRYPHTTAE